MEKQPPRIFACSNRKDQSVVGPVVRLLRNTHVTLLLGSNDKSQGKDSRVRLETSIDDSDFVIVFWSMAAARSAEMRRACDRAIGLNKEIVPVCLDDTPLADDLLRFPGIEFPDAPVSMTPPDKAQVYAASILQRVFRSHLATRLYLRMESWLTIGGGYRDANPQDQDSRIVLQTHPETGFAIHSTKNFVR